MSNPDIASLTCWCLSTNNAGMINQAIGLAEAIGLKHQVKLVTEDVPWRFLPPRFWPFPLDMKEGGGRFEPPWPDIVISCGQRSVATALAIRRTSKRHTKLIHVQNPNAPLGYFAFVVAPRHDKLKGDNLIETLGAVHRVSKEQLEEAAQHPDPRFAHLPRPLIAVLVGGSTKRHRVKEQTMRDFVGRLHAAAKTQGVGLAVTPSRRTGATNELLLRAGLMDVPAFVWDGTGQNPYFNLLAQANAIVVTGESVSMISEACATGKPVYVFELYKDNKMQPLLKALTDNGMIRPFEGKLERWHYPPLEETQQIGKQIREYLKYTDNKN